MQEPFPVDFVNPTRWGIFGEFCHFFWADGPKSNSKFLEVDECLKLKPCWYRRDCALAVEIPQTIAHFTNIHKSCIYIYIDLNLYLLGVDISGVFLIMVLSW